jgi:hypothetical protein
MTQEQAHSTESTQGKRKLSKGEQTFDFTVYGLMNWVGTFVITVPVAYWMMHGKGAAQSFREAGTKWFEGVMPGVLKVTDTILSPIRKAPPAEKMAERVKWWSEQNTITFATFQGGNIMLLPIWLAERAKVPIVKALNRLTDDKTDPATIEEAPKTDIWALVKARLTAWAIVFTTFTTLGNAVPKTFRTFSEEFGAKAAKLFGKTAYEDMATAEPLLAERAQLFEMGEAAKPRLSEVNRTLESMETSRFRLGKIASWDVVATTAAVVLLYAGSKFFTEEKERKEHKQKPRKSEPTEHKDFAGRLEKESAHEQEMAHAR